MRKFSHIIMPSLLILFFGGFTASLIILDDPNSPQNQYQSGPPKGAKCPEGMDWAFDDYEGWECEK